MKIKEIISPKLLYVLKIYQKFQYLVNEIFTITANIVNLVKILAF